MQNDKFARPRQRQHPSSMDGIYRPVRPPQRNTRPFPVNLNQRPVAAPPGIRNVQDRPPLTRPTSSTIPTKSLLNTTIPGSRSYDSRFSRTSNTPVRGNHKTHRFWRRHGKWSWKRRIGTSLALIVLVGLGLGGWDVWQLEHKINHLAVGGLTASVGGAENILIAGSTNRCNLKVQNAEWGFCSQGVTGVNSDIILIVHIVPKTKSISILSIPRDTFVPNARAGHEAFKIDAALYEGPTQLVRAIQEDFGIPIQHYAEVGFDGFVNIVNAVGGIKMDFPEPVYDAESYLNVKTPGCRLLNGVEALQVVRARHLQYDPPGLNTSNVNLWPQEVESDIARIARTHEFLRVLGSTVAAKGLGNPITDQRLIDAIAPNVQVDNGLSTTALIQLAEEFHSVNIGNIPQYTLPISTTTFGDYIYAGLDYGYIAFPVEQIDQQIINKFLGVSNSTDTMTGNPLPSPSSINVNVVNGSGTPNQASQTASALQALGFNIVGKNGTATPLSSETVETVVNYAGSSTEADAEAVARQLTGPVILSQNATMVTPGSAVTVLTGTGVTVNSPPSNASASTPSSSAQSSASTSAASSSTNAAVVTGLAVPNSATQPLAPWDPRACTP